MFRKLLISKENFIYTLIVLTMIFASGGNIHIRSIFFLTGSSLILLLHKKKINKFYVIIFLVLATYICLDSIVLNTASSDYKECVLLIIRLICCAIVASNVPMDKFKSIFLQVMVVLATVSLFFYILILIDVDLPLTNYVNGVYGAFYHTIGYGQTFEEITRRRNCSIFTEPGVYQIYLNIALLVLMKEKKLSIKKSRRAFIVLTIALLTTVSSMGYLVYTVVILLYYLERDDLFNRIGLSSKKSRRIIFFLIFIVMLILEYLTGTVTGFIRTTNSFASRHDDVLLTFLIAKDYPLFGIGLATDPKSIWDVYYYKYEGLRLYKGYQNAMSCGVGNYMAQAGIPFTLIYCICMIRGLIKFIDVKGLVSKSAIIIIIILFILEEPFLSTPIFLISFFIGSNVKYKKTNNYIGTLVDKRS